MNYLAHALLSPAQDLIFLGNFCGDFVKGSQNPGLSPEVWHGVQLHRYIDSYTDTHPIVQRSKNRISDTRKRFAGIIIDVAYDYLVSKNWDSFCVTPRKKFIKDRYATLDRLSHKLPATFIEVKDRVLYYDWLSGYHSLSGIDQTLESISRRFQKRTARPNTITGSISEIKLHLHDLEDDFLLFFPQLQEAVTTWLKVNMIKQ